MRQVGATELRPHIGERALMFRYFCGIDSGKHRITRDVALVRSALGWGDKKAFGLHHSESGDELRSGAVSKETANSLRSLR